MPGSHCCVQNCSNTSHDSHGRRRNNGIQFFRLPKWTQHLGEQVSDLTRRRRIAWLAAITRKDFTFDRTPPWMRVCSLHFHSGKPSYEMLENHPDWTPSLLLGHNDVKNTDQQLERPSPPTQDHQLQAQASPPPPAQDQLQAPPPPDQDQEQAPPPPDQDQLQAPPGQDMECGLCTSRRDVINNLLEENRELKRQLDMYRMNENFLSGDDNTVKYYTGLPNFALFQTLLLTLTPYLPQGRMKKLSPFQLVLLTLMRLRLDLPIQHLSHLFRVHRTTVADAFHHTLGVMYAQLCPLGHWPSRECLLTSMPHQFVESFGNNVAAIGIVRNKFKFLHSTVPVHMLVKCEGENLMPLDKIVTVCCALTNMCKSVV
uniref:Uncharacterized LOC114459264 n=1 Tax=Gouania willdenowi TaxID=441366 RepID=A0A8C5EBS4_GOUWI